MIGHRTGEMGQRKFNTGGPLSLNYPESAGVEKVKKVDVLASDGFFFVGLKSLNRSIL